MTVNETRSTEATKQMALKDWLKSVEHFTLRIAIPDRFILAKSRPKTNCSTNAEKRHSGISG